jgi:hypothetical protein
MRKQNTVSIIIVIVIVMNAPSNASSAADSITYSTVDGMPTDTVNYSIDETELRLNNSDLMPEGSGSGALPQEAPAELLPGTGFPLKLNSNPVSEHAWNATIRFSGSTLRPRENDVNYTTSEDGGCVYITSGDAITIWNLPLALPEGAEVQYLRIYYYDQDADNNTRGWFTKYDLYGQIVSEWGVNSEDGGNDYRDVLITPTETIDYSAYSYVINWRPTGTGPNLQLCGFRIFYYYPMYSYNFIPWISKP